jgi:hypothetical protein
MIRLKLWLGAAGAAVLAIFAAWVAGRREGRQKARISALQVDAQAQGRMNEADTHGADDDANAQWMRDYAKRNGG